MKLIPQEIVDKAADKYAIKYSDDEWEECSKYNAFKTGAEFAEKELENIIIEFGDWLVKNEYTPLQKLCWSKDSATYTSKTLFEKFLKERKL